jgi:hypothetical protein
MAAYDIYVGNGDLGATNALAEVGFSVIGPNLDESLQVQEAEGADVIRVIVRASSVEEAQRRVIDALPADGNYVLERIERLSD